MATNAPLTPTEEPANPVPDYSPGTVVYDEAFENTLMQTILYPPTRPVPKVDPCNPFIAPTALPIPLSSHLRTQPFPPPNSSSNAPSTTSPLPGLLLTHPHGYHTGGPGPTSDTIATFAEEFIREHGIRSPEELERRVAEATGERLAEVRERMRRREDAVRKNEGVRKGIRDLEVQRMAEVRVEERIRRDRERKRGGRT